jgi:hypothetical protein
VTHGGSPFGHDVLAGFLLSGNWLTQPALGNEGRDRKYVSASRAVHAVFAMFCIHQSRGVAMIVGLSIGSIDATTIPQNAGCTMDIHADCTNGKIDEQLNRLFLNDFLLIKCWHNRCNLLCMLAIQVIRS